MRISARTFIQRLITYPFLLPFFLIYQVSNNKKIIFDKFYLLRGLPHGYLKGQTRVAFYDGLVILFPFIEDPTFDDVWLRGVYDYYKPKADHMVIDIGASIGSFTLKVARNVKKVISIEPDPYNLIYLKANVNCNALGEQVTIVPVALGEENTSSYLKCDYMHGRSRLTDQKTNTIVTVKSLDNLIGELEINKVDLIKVDVEGHELEVLKGASKTLQKYSPDLVIASYHYDKEYLHLASRLKLEGYCSFLYSIPYFLNNSKDVYIYAKKIKKQ
jgi:FkbM family methyltransferase